MYLLREKKNIVRITKEFREVCSNENIFLKFIVHCQGKPTNKLASKKVYIHNG